MNQLRDLIKSSPQAFVEAASGAYNYLAYSDSNSNIDPGSGRFFAWLVHAIESGSAWTIKLLEDAPKELARWKNIFLYQIKKSAKAKLYQHLQDVEFLQNDKPEATPMESLPDLNTIERETEDDANLYRSVLIAKVGYVQVRSDTVSVLHSLSSSLSSAGLVKQASRFALAAVRLAGALAGKPAENFHGKYLKL